ncbi:DUF3618 domain-containing protein [Vreelandella maris]|uniref:DUF3618 domain-containing protein n=1 Tax=Vreelandella maris TaxID=2729617 RepID=A0A7Y6RCH4_9GAMM|nr:DUF3618 domain-containing protein [Halomonas maris]NVF14288.1 DUF3618 domain-containing protein [Halomonas maris]
MTDHDHQRSPEEIEKDINQSRERLDSTLHEIEERFSPQQLLNTSYEYIRHGGANEFVSNLGTTIKQNPLPFLVTTAGLGWLMLAQRHPNEPRHKQQYASDMDQRFYTGGQSSSGTSGSHGTPGIPVHEGTHPNAGTPTYSGGSESHSDGKGRMSRAKEGASSMKDGAKGKAQHLGEKAKHTAQQWGSKAHQMGDNMRNSSSHLQHSAHDRMHDMEHRAHQSKSQASDFIQDHPLVVGALGFALGAALGGLFPATKKEDEYMGEYRDRVMHKAAETGQAQADKAQHTIHEKAESAKGDSHRANDANVNAPQHQEAGIVGSPTPTPTTERSAPESHDQKHEHQKHDHQKHDPQKHSQGLAGSSTPSGNTQGSGTNHTP